MARKTVAMVATDLIEMENEIRRMAIRFLEIEAQLEQFSLFTDKLSLQIAKLRRIFFSQINRK